MTRKRAKGTELKVFSGREAALNFVIFLLLYPEGKLLASYDILERLELSKDSDAKEDKTLTGD